MASGGNTLYEEFIVDTKQVSEITRAKSKIERMHEVKIRLNEVAKLDSKESKQWIRVEGDIRDRMNAREYIIAMCQPCETYTLPYHNCRELLNEDNLEEIEKQTNACIETNDVNTVLVKGSDLAVTLAISSLENIIGHSNVDTDGVEEPGTSSHEGSTALQPTDWEKRLDSTFLRALSHASDGSCKYDDYHNTSAEVKMTILKCLNDDLGDNVDDNELFEQSGSALHPITIYGDDDKSNMDEKDGVSSKVGVDNLSEQLVDTIISPRKQSDLAAKPSETEEVKFLRNFGTSAGYTEEIIDEGLMYVDDKTAPCEFLDILKQLKNSKKSESTDTPMEISEEPPNQTLGTSFPPPPQIDPGGQGRRSLPKEYKNTLFKHMTAEEGRELTVDELKKQNEERQKLLKEQFESLSKQDSPRGEKSRRKKKNKKKANKKVGQNNNIISTDQSSAADEDETCVLKTYNSSSEDDCVVTSVEKLPLANVQLSFDKYPPTQRQPVGPQINYFSNNCPVTENQHMMKQASGNRELRYIVIDGSNVAMHHGRGKVFSCQGIKICVEYFLNRGHQKIMCFVPGWRKYKPRPQNPITDQEILLDLNEKGWLEFTPARRLENKLISSYDDRYVVELAERVEGIIVSNDQYRDLMREKYSWKKIIEERLLQYNFVGDFFMAPNDPLGKDGPTLDEFLSKPSKQPSPLRKRHLSPPDASEPINVWNQPPPPLLNQHYPPPSILGPVPGTEWQLQRYGLYQNQFQSQNQEQTRFQWKNQGQFQNRFQVRNQGQYPNTPRFQNFQGQGQPRFQGQNRFSHPQSQKKKGAINQKQSKPQRTAEKTEEIITNLKDIFPDSEDKIKEVVDNHPTETDVTRLSNYVLNALND